MTGCCRNLPLLAHGDLKFKLTLSRQYARDCFLYVDHEGGQGNGTKDHESSSPSLHGNSMNDKCENQQFFL